MVGMSAAASREAVRAYLTDAVGVGGTFTMLDLRNAVPGANQVDRRMRELRQAVPPWVIHSHQSDPSLPPDTYRVVEIGGMKLAPKPSAKVRREVFEAADNRCQVCGIGLGEEYAEYPGMQARLQLGHWVPLEQGGSPTSAGNLRSECHLCNGGIRNLTAGGVTQESVKARASALPRRSREELLAWLRQGRREVSGAEKLFYEVRQLPPSAQQDVLAALRAGLLDSP